jgi:hypothetical protein
MVWHKAWLDTRTKFLVVLAVLVVIAVGNVFGWVQVQAILPNVSVSGGSRVVADAVNEALEAERTFRGYIWNNWFAGNFKNCLVLFAALLGSGSTLSPSGRGMLFSLALPVLRSRWFAARAAIGLVELFALALVPSLVIALLAPAVNESYSLADAMVHGLLAFVVGSVFYALAMLASAIFDDLWRAMLLTVVAAIALAVVEYGLPTVSGLFAAMSGRTYYYDGTLPWLGLIVSVALTLALLYAACLGVRQLRLQRGVANTCVQ